MQIDKSYINERIKELEQQRDQHRGTAFACEGAIQAMQAMLQRLDQKEPDPKADAAASEKKS